MGGRSIYGLKCYSSPLTSHPKQLTWTVLKVLLVFRLVKHLSMSDALIQRGDRSLRDATLLHLHLPDEIYKMHFLEYLS